ncbi:MAG: FAD binding domain-containing protein [Terriglobales bacterium]|jgi:CO/xanthine dehydrogenase FAD-binding subunit
MPSAAVKEFLQPSSPQEVVELLVKYRERALVVGGGTFLHGIIARGLLGQMDVLIDLQKVGLSYVKYEHDTLCIGATTTFAELAASERVQNSPELGAVLDALCYPPAQIRNMATVAGCVASATPLFDLPVALMALDGAVRAAGPKGSREIGLHKFYLDYFEHVLERTELITEILVLRQPSRSASAFLKLETNANDLALLNVAVRITVDKKGTCRDARVVVGGGIGKVPVRAVSCEDVLKGQYPTAALLKESGNVVAFDIHPVSDYRTSAKYRSTVAKVFVRRALLRALDRLGMQLDEPS